MKAKSRASTRWIVWIIAALSLSSQTSIAAAPGAEGSPLFASDTPLAITLDMPFNSIISKASEKPVVDGSLHFRGADGADVEIDITVTTRGRSRLAYCNFPPLKVNLKRKQTKGTIFKGQKKLKIVTHCKNGTVHNRYLQQEFAIYKAYNELTDFSYRVRWITVTYRDSAGKRIIDNRGAFFIESSRELAKRLGRERVRDKRVPSARLDAVESSRYALFQYLIANTDWSMLKGPGDEGCCHNGKVLIEPDSTENWVVVPYDFDQAGLLNTKYALPAEGLRIHRVTQRLFRGRCRHNDQLDATIKLFNERRQQLESQLATVELSGRQQKKTLSYIDAFYKIVNDPKKRQRLLFSACVGT